MRHVAVNRIIPLLLFVALLVMSAAWFNIASASVEPDCPPPGLVVDAVVLRVIDGDTLILRTSFEYRVRLLDCWAPESRTLDLKEKTRGLAAKKRLTQLAANQCVRVQLPGSTDLSRMVTLNRVLGRVWLVNDEGPAEMDLSGMLVSEGLATAKKAEQ